MSSPLLAIFEDVALCARTEADIRKGAYRLDASFYSAENRAAVEALEASGLDSISLTKIADVFCSGVRERTFVSPGKGHALLTGSDLDTTSDADLRYVSPIFTRNYPAERLVRGDVLISSAGTVGKCDFVWNNHEGRIASQDIVRVRANRDKVLPGYLYALLSSPFGNALLVNQSAGSVIVRVYTEHLGDVLIPRLPNRKEEQISDKVVASFEERAAARELLNEVRENVLRINKLAHFPELDETEPACFDVIVSDFQSEEFRLEANFYNPLARAAVANIRACASPSKTVRQLSYDVIMGGRFKRNYVESDHGTPFLSGKSIIQIRPTDLKHLSNSQTDDLSALLVKRGWIIITCSGTIGRTCFVWHNFENYAASQHILRVLPDSTQVDAGYLYAFLSSAYGYQQMLRYRHGSVIDEITDQQLSKVLVPIPPESGQKEIGDQVRRAYEKRANALKLEDEAQKILTRELKGHNTKEKLHV